MRYLSVKRYLTQFLEKNKVDRTLKIFLESKRISQLITFTKNLKNDKLIYIPHGSFSVLLNNRVYKFYGQLDKLSTRLLWALKPGLSALWKQDTATLYVVLSRSHGRVSALRAHGRCTSDGKHVAMRNFNPSNQIS